MNRKTLLMMSLAAVGAISAIVAGVSAYAQSSGRDPAYQAARTAGLVGEKPDGYLGFVVPPTPDIRKMVDDINIRRKEQYTLAATEQNVTVQLFAQRTACNLILRTAIGEKYMDPEGVWRTRTAEPPVRDASCL